MMMKITRADLVKRSKADNAYIGEANGRMEKRIKKLYADYRRQIKALVKDPDLYTESKTFNLAVAAETINGISTLLDKLGRDDLITEFVDEFSGMTVQAREYFKQFGKLPQLGGTSEEAFNAYISYSADILDKTLDTRLVEPIKDGLWHATFGTMPRSTVVDTVISLADDLTERQAVTLVDDTFRQYQRAVTNTIAEELGLEVFWYQGPEDDITSDQCEFILNEDLHGVAGMYYRDEISIDLHPNLRDDPFIAGGHFNCRHKFYPVTLDFAKSQGFKP